MSSDFLSLSSVVSVERLCVIVRLYKLICRYTQTTSVSSKSTRLFISFVSKLSTLHVVAVLLEVARFCGDMKRVRPWKNLC